jgi:hypothetical protein
MLADEIRKEEKPMSWFELRPDEKELGSWTVNYLPPGGGRYTGPLVVTDQRLLFKFANDTSASGVLKKLFFFRDTHGYIAIPRERIRSIDRKSGLLNKRVRVTLDDGEAHVFDHGMLSIDAMAAAIESGKA